MSKTLARDRFYRQAEGAKEGAQRELAQLLGRPRRYWDSLGKWTCPQCGEICEWEEYEEPAFGPKSIDEGDFAPCRCIREAGKAGYEAYIRDSWSEAVQDIWDNAGFTPRDRGCTFENYQPGPQSKAAWIACRRYADEFVLGQTDSGLFLMGPFGTGKSHLAIATARSIVERTLAQVHFTSTLQLLVDLKATFRRDGGDENGKAADPVATALEAELLIMDDLGQEMPSEFNRTTIAYIVRRRYELQLPTIYTSNQADTQIAERLGGDVVSRLYRNCQALLVDGPDFRKNKPA